MGKAFFYIKNLSYDDEKGYLYAGDRYNKDIYIGHNHIDHNKRDTAKWIFEPVLNDGMETGYFYIKDMKHSKYILAGDNFDGSIYHDSLRGVLNEQWKLEFASVGENKGWVITDRKHKKSLVGKHCDFDKVFHEDAKKDGQIMVKAIWKVAYCEGGGVNDFPLFLLKKYGEATKCKIEHIDTVAKEVYSMEIELDPKVDINKSDEDYTIKTTQEENYTLTSSTKITDEFAQKVIDLVSDGKTGSWEEKIQHGPVFQFKESTVKTTTSTTKKVTKEYVWKYQKKEDKERGKCHLKFTCYTHIMKYKVTTTVKYNDGNRQLDGEFTSNVVVEKGNNWNKD